MLKVFVLIIFTSFSFACVITPKSTYYSYKTSEYEADFEQCNNEQIQQFQNLIANAEGNLSSRQYKRYVSSKNVTLKKSFKILKFKDYVIKTLKLPKDISLDFKTAYLNSNILSINPGETLEIECDSCHQAGLSNIKVSKKKGSKHKVTWLSANTLFLRNVIVAKKSIPYSNNTINLEHFTSKELFVEDPTQLITDIKSLKHYRLNRMVNKNQIISLSDVSKVHLVQYGKPVKAFIRRKNLHVTIDASPLENGFFGNTIKLKNIKTNKTIVGKVIDLNKVEVNL